MAFTYRAIQPTESLAIACIDFGDGNPGTAFVNTLKTYLAEHGVATTDGHKMMFFSTGSDPLEDARCSIEYVNDGTDEYTIHIRFAAAGASAGWEYRISNYTSSERDAGFWYDEDNEKIDGIKQPSTGSYAYGLESVTIGGSTYNITQEQNTYLFNNVGIKRGILPLTYTQKPHVNYINPPSQIPHMSAAISVEVTADSGYELNVDQAQITNVFSKSYDETTHILSLTGAYGDVDVDIDATPVGPGPTPTDEENYCYVDRIKKFITRMEGNKFSEVE